MYALGMLFIVFLFLAVLIFVPQQDPRGDADSFMSWAYRLWDDDD